MITQKVRLWGTALGVHLPPDIAQQVGLEEGTIISICVEGHNIVLAPAHPKYTLDELFKAAGPTSQADEWHWGPAIGEEHW